MGLLAALRRPQWLIVLGGAVGVAMGLLASALGPQQYTAGIEQLVTLTAQGQAQGQTETVDLDQAARRVRSYLPLATSAWVLQPVVRDLRLDTDATSLAEEVAVTNPPGTVLIRISVTDSDPGRASRVAAAIGARFGRAVQDLERPAQGGGPAVSVHLVQGIGARAVPHPRRTMVDLLIGLLLGLAAGTVAAVLRHRADQVIRDGAAAQAVTGTRPLAAVPLAGAPAGSWAPATDHGEAGPGVIRTLRANLTLADLDRPSRRLVVTSPSAGSGATETACSIASGLARDGHRVILVEADLRRPQVCGHLLLPHSGHGLTSVLARQQPLDEVLVPRLEGMLVVLPAGPLPPDPAALLGSRQMADLLTDLSATFDYVILAGPPLLDAPDSVALAGLVDGALVVVRQGRTTRDQLARAGKALAAGRARLIGTVLATGTRPAAQAPTQAELDDDALSRPAVPSPRSERTVARQLGHTGRVTLPHVAVRRTRSAGGVTVTHAPRPEDLPAVAPASVVPPAVVPPPPVSPTRVVRRVPPPAAPRSIVLPDAASVARLASPAPNRRRRGAAPAARADLTVLTGSTPARAIPIRRITGERSARERVTLVDDAIRLAWQSAGTGAAAGRHRKP